MLGAAIPVGLDDLIVVLIVSGVIHAAFNLSTWGDRLSQIAGRIVSIVTRRGSETSPTGDRGSNDRGPDQPGMGPG